MRKRDGVAGGDSTGEQRGEGVEMEGESCRAEGLCAVTQPMDVGGGSHSRSSGHLCRYKADFQTCAPALKSLPWLLILASLLVSNLCAISG